MRKLSPLPVLLFLLVLFVIPLFPGPVSYVPTERVEAGFWEDLLGVGDKPEWTIDGDAVFVDNRDVYIEVSPHTLTASGWVTIDYWTKNYSGPLDIVYGFNGIDGVQAANPQIYEEYEHTLYRQVQGQRYYVPTKEDLLENPNAKAGYRMATENEPYHETFWDWNDVKAELRAENHARAGCNRWQSAGLNQIMRKNTLYTAKVWIDIPISLEPIEGKYIVGLKPAGADIADAWILDPWYDASWQYRQKFTVANTEGQLTDYQIQLAVHYGAGTSDNWTVFCDNHCQTDFDDIRFTRADGSTLLDFWRESMCDSDNSTIWVELDSVTATGETDFYIYYGNAAATYPTEASTTLQGQATFIHFDDFERGVDGDEVGGIGTTIWTESSGTVEISMGQSFNGTCYYGTRGMKLEGTAAAAMISTPVTHSDSIAIQSRAYKEDAHYFVVQHGDATERTFVAFQATESIEYYDGAFIATGSSCVADAWFLNEERNYDWVADTFDIYYNGVNIQNAATMDTNGTMNNIVRFSGDVGAGKDTWIDNFFVRNYREANPPFISAWEDEEEVELTVISMETAKVFSGYIETGDWLITCLYKNVAGLYYDDHNVQDYFYIQLVDPDDGSVKAQTKCPEWGYKPGAIYLSPAMVESLEWGKAYRVRLYGDYGDHPYADYALQGTDWMGVDLTRLDAWVRTAAVQMEAYYGVALTVYIAGKGIALNEDGGVIFANCIPALVDVRPGLFQIAASDVTWEQGEYTHAYADSLAWQTFMGEQLTRAYTTMGGAVGLSGSTIGTLIAFAIYAFAAVFAFPAGHAIAAIVLPSPILYFVWGTGMAEMALMGILLAVAVILFSWQFWWKG